MIILIVEVEQQLMGQWEQFCYPWTQAAEAEIQKQNRADEEKRATAIAHFFEDHPELLPTGIELTWDVMFNIAINSGIADTKSTPGYWGGKRDDIWREGSQRHVVKIRGEEFTR